MSLIPDLDTFFKVAQPGDWCYTHSNHPADGSPAERYIAIRLTAADDGDCILPIYQDGDPKPAPNAWLWDGNIEAPTLTPSIFHHSVRSWHGWLRAGKLVLA